MNVLLFLNELSQEPPAEDARTGQARMKGLLDTVARVRSFLKLSRPVLRLRDHLDTVQLAPGYPVVRWRNDDGVPRDLRLRFKQLLMQMPVLERPRDPAAAMNAALTTQCRREGHGAVGLTAAHAAGGMGVSFLSAKCWDTAWLNVDADELSEDGAITTRELPFRHASREPHVDTHGDWLAELDRRMIRDGLDLWDRRAELFPALEFCRELRVQLAEFRGGDPELAPMTRRLFELQGCFDKWINDDRYKNDHFPFEIVPSKCTPESEATLQQFEREHTFTRPSGESLLFSWHVRFTPDPGRIFFRPDDESHKGILGYVGKQKLPNVKFH